MADIGRLNLKLGLSPGNLIGGLGGVRDKIQNFGSSVTGLFGGLTNKLAGFMEKPLFGLFDLGAANEIDRISKAADNLGLMTEQLSALEYAASLSGTSTAGLTRGIAILNRQLGKVSVVGEDATGKLEQFGLDSKALLTMSSWERILAIADKYVELGNEVDRTALAMQAFGKGGFEMMKLLEEGSGGLRKMAAEAKAFGLTFSRQQGAGVEAALDAISRMQAVFEGFRKQFAIALAPVVEKIATLFTDWIKDMGGVPALVNKIVNTFLDLAAVLVNIAESLTNMVQSIRRFGGRLGGTAEVMFKDGGWIKNLLRPGSLDEQIKQIGEEVGAGIKNVDFSEVIKKIEALRNKVNANNAPIDLIGFGTEKGLEALRRMQRQQVELQKAVQGTAEPLMKQIQLLSMSAEEATLNALAAAGANKAQLDFIAGLQAQVKELERIKGLQDSAKQIFEQTRTPMERFAKEMERVNEMFVRGFLDADTYLRAVSQLEEQFMKAGKAQSAFAGGALMKGSVEAIRAVQQFEFGQKQAPQEKKVPAILEQQRQIQQQQLQEQKKAARALQEIANPKDLL